jgi:superfamily II DNA helicase RecQ
LCRLVLIKFYTYHRQNFRPAYARLGELATSFPNVPVVGLTATANFATQKEICWTLGLLDPVAISIIPDRPNIHFASFRIKERGEAEGCIKYFIFWDHKAKKYFLHTKKQMHTRKCIQL